MNENQEIVLNYLKKQFEDYGSYPIDLLVEFDYDCVYECLDKGIIKAYKSLTYKQEFEVLAAFAEWGLKQ
ncbi:MAG: hypothetical protein ABF624_00040 [Liquorilactobacillus ghanensis]|uniref:hypothetical protein n=1 Tax=Liquorilactobacillus ghanensis TaxID=399370 RepID=UPI0039EBB7A1